MASQAAHPYRTLSSCWDMSWGAASPPSPDSSRGAATLCVPNLIWSPRGVSEKHLQFPRGVRTQQPLCLSPFLFPVCPDHQVLVSLMQPPGTGNHPVPRGCLPVPTSPGGSRPPPQFLPRDVVLLQCPLCVETPSSSSPAPAALPCRDVRPCLLSCTHPATKRLAFFGSPAELNISHLFL